MATIITTDMAKAKEIHKTKIRAARPSKFAELDIEFQRALETSADTSAIIAKNKSLGLTKLLNHNPKEIINSIVGYDNLHFFPFGGINELVDWKKI